MLHEINSYLVYWSGVSSKYDKCTQDKYIKYQGIQYNYLYN